MGAAWVRAAYGAVFAIGVGVMLAVIYWKTTSYMSQQMDHIVSVEMATYASAEPDDLPLLLRQVLLQGAGGVFALVGAIYIDTSTSAQQLIQQGTQEELMRQPGMYQQLYEAQVGSMRPKHSLAMAPSLQVA